VAAREPFMLGVNYWPRRKAMYWWSDFDAGEVREDFALIRELGLTTVRIFLLWDDFQPQPESVSTACLENLVTVADIAVENDLTLDVTFFTGHMSGPNWSPRWLLGGSIAPHERQIVSRGELVDTGYRNPYTDAVALAAERLLVETVVTALKDHPGIWLWNLGNEPDIFAEPPDETVGKNWVGDLAGVIRGIDPDHAVTCGLHMHNLYRNNGLRVDQVFAETDLAVMHTYSIYAPLARDPDFVPFACSLTSALCGKPVLMEEFGGCTAPPGQPSFEWQWQFFDRTRRQFMIGEDELAEFLSAVLPRLVDVGVTGAMIWCFADYSPELWHKPPCSTYKYERFFGLVRPDGTLKPHAQVLRDFAATKPKLRKRPKYRLKLDITADEYYTDPDTHMPRLYEQYLAEAAAKA